MQAVIFSEFPVNGHCYHKVTEAGIVLMFVEDSSEVPNQSGSSIVGTIDNSTAQSAASSATVPVVSSAEMLHPPQQQRSEATSSGSASQAESGNVSGVVTSQASPSTASSFTRGRHIPPLCSNSRQQQLLLVSYIQFHFM